MYCTVNGTPAQGTGRMLLDCLTQEAHGRIIGRPKAFVRGREELRLGATSDSDERGSLSQNPGISASTQPGPCGLIWLGSSLSSPSLFLAGWLLIQWVRGGVGSQGNRSNDGWACNRCPALVARKDPKCKLEGRVRAEQTYYARPNSSRVRWAA